MSITTKSPVRVLVVEDDEAVRTQLSLALSATAGLTVLETTASLIGALHQVKELKPDLVVVARSLLSGRGMDIIRPLLSMEDSPELLIIDPRRIVSGRAGSASDREGANGKSVPMVAGAVIATARKPACLSPRECEVLRLVATGMSSREVAGKLGLSVRTVENHRARIARRTGLRSVAQLTLYAAQRGLVHALAPAVASLAPLPNAS